MAGTTDYWARKIIDHSTGKTDIGALPTIYIALFTAVGTDAGSGFTEVSGTNYARIATAGGDWNAASGSAPSTTTNAADITFALSGSSWGTVIALGAYDALTSGNLLWWDYLGNFSWLPFTCTNATPGVLTAPAHGYSNGDSVVVNIEYGGSLPTTGGSWSGLLTVANVTTDTFTVGVNTTSTGNGQIRKISSQAIAAGVRTVILAGSLTVSLA